MDENNSSAPLLPCPFCGGPAGFKDGGGWHGAGCIDLPCPGYPIALAETSPAKAAASWNTRAAQAVAAQAPAAVAVPEITDAMVDAYLAEQRRTVEDADRFGRPNIGGLHTNTVREACRNGLRAALAATPAATEDSSAGDLAGVQVADAMSREERMIVLQRNADGTPSVWCDPEIADIVRALNSGGVKTVASCSGHGEKPGGIALADGRQLLLLESLEAFTSALDAISGEAEVQAEPAALQMCSELKPRSESEKAAYLAGVADGRMYAERDADTAPQAQPADALLLDYLQDTGSTVEIIPGPTGWNFRVGGLHATARPNLRSSIDAAMAAAQEGGNHA